MKAQKTITIGLDVLKALDDYCQKKDYKYNRVIDRAIREFLKREGAMNGN